MSFDRDQQQRETKKVSVESVMRRAAFRQGVDDRRAGRPPQYDVFGFEQSDGPAFAHKMTDAHWDYERGRLFASLAPMSMPLYLPAETATTPCGRKVRRERLNPKAVALVSAAFDRGYIT